jgi:hypothetical protein
MARHRLQGLYAREAQLRHGLGPGLSDVMHAYRRLEEDGLATVRDDGLEWHWPDDDQAARLDLFRTFPTAIVAAATVGLALLFGAALMGVVP